MRCNTINENNSVERGRPKAARFGSLRGFAATAALTSNVKTPRKRIQRLRFLGSRRRASGRQSRHVEAARFELRHQRLALSGRELDERRPHRRPIRIAPVVRDDRFQRRHHRIFLHDAARGGDVLLKHVRARAAPVFEDLVDRAGIDVAGRGDAALAAVPHVVEQEHLAARASSAGEPAHGGNDVDKPRNLAKSVTVE